MVASNDSKSTARCEACGYQNAPEARRCGLCGGYLFGAVAPRRSAGAPAAEAESAAPIRPPAPAPAAAAAARVRIALDAAPAEQALPEAPSAPRAPGSHDLYTTPGPRALAREPVPEPAAPPATPAPLPGSRALAQSLPPPSDEHEAGHELLEQRARRERALERARQSVGLAFATAVLVSLPSSLQPLSLLLHGVGAVLYGFPVGYVANRRGMGLFRGGALGAGLSVAYAIAQGVCFSQALPGEAVDWQRLILSGALSGWLAGAWSGRRF
jgi:hypothetical protein